MWLLNLLLFPVLAWFVPGYAASRWVYPLATPLERFATTILLGILAVVPTTFFTIFLLRTPLTPVWILSFAVALAGFFFYGARRWPRRNAPPPMGEQSGQSVFVVVGLVILTVYLSLSTRPRHCEALELFAPCPHESAQLLLDDGTGSGLNAWDPRWERYVNHLATREHEPGYGLGGVLDRQRVGSMATISQPFAFHGSAGLVVATFCYDLLVVALAALLFATRIRRWWLTLLMSTVFLLGVRTVASYVVNENMLGLGLSMGYLWFLLRSEYKAEAALAGCCAALCFGVRPITAAYLPAALIFLWPSFRQRLPVFLGVAALCALPWFIVNFQVFGHPLHHPSLGKGQFVHHFLGMEFMFHPLNFPFQDTILRPFREPFPELFKMPLEHLAAFGSVFWVLVLCGGVATRAGRLLTFLLWGLPVYALLLVIVSADHEKLSYALLAFTPLPLLAGTGVRALTDSTFTIKDKVVAAAVSAGVLVGFPALLTGLQFEVDKREHYHNNWGYEGASLKERREALIHPPLLPTYQENPGPAWSLLVHGASPQLSDDAVLDGPAYIWRKFVNSTHRFRQRLTDSPVVAQDLGDFVSAWGIVSINAGISIKLRHSSRTPKVTFIHHANIIEIKVETGADGNNEGYLNISFLDSELAQLRTVSLSVDGQNVPLDYYLAEEPGADGRRVIQLVTNHPWRMELKGSVPRLLPGFPLSPECERKQVGEAVFE
ncbi:MAG TPA: hypothetical protein EYN06_04070, partial [Myxococcales bacterium]|nr:hypothetical protein [Myxococcales bacterium]